MSWFNSVVFYLGLFDAATIMLGGLVLALVILMGWDTHLLWSRVAPALGVLIASNIAAALTLWATKAVIGG